jgi:hypothetical protein
MTLQQFLNKFYCKVDIQIQGDINLVITTEAIRRSDDAVVYSARASYNIQDVSQKISDSQTGISLSPFDWEKVIDETKRAHLDYFAQRAPIEDYYSLDRINNPDISIFYQK